MTAEARATTSEVPRKLSLRTCVACRTKMSRRELLRFVRDDSGCVVFDQRQRLPGRGVWTCCTLDCFDMAVARGALARGLKLPGVAAREALSEEVIGKLRTSVASYLSISK